MTKEFNHQKFLEELIDKSFLQKEEKNLLMEILKKQGASDNFYKKFNEFLISNLKEKFEKYEKKKVLIENSFNNLQKEYSQKREELFQKLQENLNQIPEEDFLSKDKLWDEYYSSLKNLSQEYEKKCRELSSQFISKILEDVL